MHGAIVSKEPNTIQNAVRRSKRVLPTHNPALNVEWNGEYHKSAMATSTMPIAIVGMGCRFPSARGPEQLWNDLISQGRSAWTDVPKDRYNWKSFHHPNLDVQGTHNQRGGHFLDQDVAAFDARFFGLAPLEAAAMDPQQRIVLEVAYEALENAGLPLEKIQGSNTGVFVATFTHDFELMNNKDPCNLPKYLLTGIGQAILSNRISYTFDFKGKDWLRGHYDT